VARYAACAEVLRTLTVAEPVMLRGSADPLRLVLRAGAEACERVGQIDQELTQTLRRVAELEDLLSRAAEVLAAEPLPIDGGSWPVFELAQEVQRILDPPEQVEEGLR
jgi:hypothetical protein